MTPENQNMEDGNLLSNSRRSSLQTPPAMVNVFLFCFCILVCVAVFCLVWIGWVYAVWNLRW